MHRVLFLLLVVAGSSGLAFDGAAVVSFYGYDDCIRLKNESTTVTLCPAAGGRVLEYALNGKNVLYLPPGDEGWTYSPEAPRARMNAGRFDIGPEKVVRRGPLLWMGRWKGKITRDRTAVLTSQVDPVSGVQLEREFVLHPSSTLLACTQTIKNVSDQDVNLCHWSRTFAVGKGIAIVPRSPRGRFPVGYVMYEGGNRIIISPQDDNIDVTDENIIIKAAPAHPKLGFDSHRGWLAYLAPSNQLFVKRFATYPDRSYNEVAGLTISIWYPKGLDTVELEPIGPAELIQPGQSASYTEQWLLSEYEFSEDFDIEQVNNAIDHLLAD